MPDKLNFSDDDIESLLKDIYDGAITPRRLSEELYFGIAGYLKKGLYKGFGGTLIDFDGPPLELLTQLRENIYIFSAAKTFQQTLEMSEALTDGNSLLSFREFKQKAADIYARHNGGAYLQDSKKAGYLQAEYETAVTSGQSAYAWKDIEATKDMFPVVTFSAVMDANTTKECSDLNGKAFFWNDPIWAKCVPPLHWFCRSLLLKGDDISKALPRSESAKLQAHAESHMQDMFKNNPGKTGEVFNKDAPYFSVPAKYKEWARENFGLPIPPVTTERKAKTAKQLMDAAQAAGPEVEAIAKGIASKHGGRVTPLSYKSEDSITRKAKTDYNGDYSKIMDAARTTIVADKKNIGKIVKEFEGNKDITHRIKKQEAKTDALGYSGTIININTTAGIKAEIQVNTPEMIYAKQKKSSAIKILGETTYNKIEKETGLPGGLGHKYYEEYRKLNPTKAADLKRMKELEKVSKEYYSHFY